ncbi:hypothetical protein IFM89_022873 [Coptis chinensis]|uniref:BURP domain-containing protein n=1 Tax=Coptis chinensis TaxID=261450 RepID=A0A835HNT4_9MAGN|nr:hypothetical protein IFM89_022873 [Coptis chinensis]
MGSRLLPIFAILLIAVVVSHAALPSEVYWDKVLPNTPMPKAVRELLRPGHKGKPVVVIADYDFANYLQNYAASEDQLHADPNVPFFLEKDLKSGTKMNVHFTRTTNGARFLPRKVAEAIPLSSNKFPEVLKQFSVEPQSMEAEAMKQTVKECEKPASQEEEEKSCATSLESMVDFITSNLGKHVQPMSTEIDKQETPKQKYIIAPGVKKMGGENSVVCHKQTYAYAVFYCHKTKSTEAYKVPLVGADGTKATAVAVCHTDTSKWNPKHLAFQVLKVKPGTVPICHFLPEDHIVWTSN